MSGDFELVKSILDGDMCSFNLLINRYEEVIFKFVYGMIKNNESAKDVTQEVFITVYNKLYTFKGQSKFSNWLFQIARNKSLDYLRKNKRTIELNIDDAFDAVSRELLPDQCVELKETMVEIKNFIKALDEIDRQILLLRGTKENMKFSDIAEILKIKDSTVKTKYYRLWDKYIGFLKKQEERCSI